MAYAHPMTQKKSNRRFLKVDFKVHFDGKGLSLKKAGNTNNFQAKAVSEVGKKSFKSVSKTL